MEHKELIDFANSMSASAIGMVDLVAKKISNFEKTATEKELIEFAKKTEGLDIRSTIERLKAQMNEAIKVKI